MSYKARVPEHGAENGFTLIDVDGDFSGATNPLQEAAHSLQARGYHEGIVFHESDSPDVMATLDSGYAPEGDHIAHLDAE